MVIIEIPSPNFLPEKAGDDRLRRLEKAKD